MASASENMFHQWRSRTIDGFARAENSIDRLLRRANSHVKGEVLSDRIKRLRKISSTWPEERKGKVDRNLDELVALLQLRNDIVHSEMVVRGASEGIVASFANPHEQCDLATVCCELSARQFQALEGKVRHLASELGKA